MSLYVNGVEQVAIHSYPGHTDVARYKFLSVGEGKLLAGNLVTANYGIAADGAGDSDAPIVQWVIKVPDNFVSFSYFKAIWCCEMPGGNMYWQLLANYYACGEVSDQHEDEPALGTTVNGALEYRETNCQSPANPLTLPGLTVDDFIGVKFNHNGSHENDTLPEYMFLYGLLFGYIGHQ